MASEEYKVRKRAYITRYQKDNYANFTFKLRIGEDQDVIQFLNSVPNKSQLIKDLIRKEMSDRK